jgi:hypothetical protein
MLSFKICMKQSKELTCYFTCTEVKQGKNDLKCSSVPSFMSHYSIHEVNLGHSCLQLVKSGNCNASCLRYHPHELAV